MEFCFDWSERKLRSAIETVFKDKLHGLPSAMFHFVRGIGDILVRPSLQANQDCSAKVVKLFARQGPIYVRAVEDITSWGWKEADSTENKLNLIDVTDSGDEVKPKRIFSIQNENTNPLAGFSNPGPSSDPTEGEKLIQLTETFPSHSQHELLEALAVHNTVTMTTLALSTATTNESSDTESDLMQPTFLPRKSDVLTLRDILNKLQSSFGPDKEKVKADEDDVLNDALAYYKEGNFDAKKRLGVIYKGQPAADTGGVTWQFYTQLVEVISQQLFRGDTFKIPIYNSNMVVSAIMKLVGTIIVLSILQGGPGLPVFCPSVYLYW